ncbi:hypothetical protein L1887_25674 [Cichorium endivia]|nr:hypothetical protein L1887_25674 [Cichorium endivia]
MIDPTLHSLTSATTPVISGNVRIAIWRVDGVQSGRRENEEMSSAAMPVRVFSNPDDAVLDLAMPRTHLMTATYSSLMMKKW